jgi:hypothetical protein
MQKLNKSAISFDFKRPDTKMVSGLFCVIFSDLITSASAHKIAGREITKAIPIIAEATLAKSIALGCISCRILLDVGPHSIA